MTHYLNVYSESPMTIISKFFILPALIILAISLSIMEEISLRSIYRYFGEIFDIHWITIRNNSFIITNFGHTLVYFIITGVSIATFRKNIQKLIFIIVIFSAGNEIFQLFIETRQASWQDFLYNLTGITLALIIYFIIKYSIYKNKTIIN